MALASLTASLPIAVAAAAAVRFRFRFRIGHAMASSGAATGVSATTRALPARVGVVQMTSIGDVDANYATCSCLTKASPP
ncbi:unnamed protein product [Miscanthus lutarioriparius]|uniref:Secreted protein n=1 Tax=Miscanthus lutarioriparius TaxID=422564 RepID=A0A811RJ70_9POAL|nr:unnamed protein product [Miscanthus lutarioriparius]